MVSSRSGELKVIADSSPNPTMQERKLAVYCRYVALPRESALKRTSARLSPAALVAIRLASRSIAPVAFRFPAGGVLGIGRVGKGTASRAARDLLDLLGDSGEDITFFAIHDADAYGTNIFHALQEATAARGARKVKIINLGLEPWEGLEMGLPVERVEKPKVRRPVAPYVRERLGQNWEA
jgi:hypothetical protein